MRRLAPYAAFAVLAACSGPSGDDETTPTVAETDANTTALDEATEEVSEAAALPTLESKDGIRLVPVADGLRFPWSMVFLPNGDMIISEREGQLRIMREGVLLPDPIAGTPEALVDGQGGYFGMVLDPDFANNRRLYLSYANGEVGANTTAVVAGTLSDDASELTNVAEIFRGTERETSLHFGGRLAFLSDGTLLVTMGEGFRYMDEAEPS